MKECGARFSQKQVKGDCIRVQIVPPKKDAQPVSKQKIIANVSKE